MQKKRLIDSDSLIRDFTESVNYTGISDLKNAIIYSINNSIYNSVKTVISDKLNIIQDKFISGVVSTEKSYYENICYYLEKTDPLQYKKYIETFEDVKQYVKNGVVHYLLPINEKYKFKCKDNTLIFCKIILGSFGTTYIYVYFVGRHHNKHCKFLYSYCNKNNKKNIDIYNVYLNENNGIENDLKEIDGVNETSIIFDQKRSIFGYINAWKRAKDYFDRLGLNNKIGILLYGDPGTGKTTFAKVLATKYEMSIVNFKLNDLSKIIGKNRFWELLEDSVVVLEDIDCLVSKRDESVATEDKENFQALLQLLDGINSCNNTIFVATTNYIDRLDPALIRDGRFDIKIEMKNFDRNNAIKMCNKFDVNSEVVLRDEKFPINPASLQNKIIKLRMEEINEKMKQKAEEIRSNN